MPASPRLLFVSSVLAFSASRVAIAQDYGFDHAQRFLREHCERCHSEKAGVGGFRVSKLADPGSLRSEVARWASSGRRVINGEMPPQGAAPVPLDAKEKFSNWVESALRQTACAAGVQAGPSPIRRLNRDEYSATIRDLLEMQMDVATSLPADGAGGEGFDNAAETLFLSPLHSEKYMEIAKFAMDFAAREFKPRSKILIAKPGPGLSEDEAARRIFAAFLPNAFRRPIADAEVTPYLDLFRASRKSSQPFDAAIFFSLRAALVSPNFLFRREPVNETTTERPLDGYSLASRLSYLLWGSMPDELLFDAAASGKLHEPQVLKPLIEVMLRNEKSRTFALRFVEQWLHTRELAGTKAPDAKLFPKYAADEDLRSDIRLQPVYFFREVFLRNESVLSFLDSRHTIATSHLTRHMEVQLPLNKDATTQPHWVELPPGTENRGGLLGMPAVLAVSSYPYRTSPVLRGAWILENLLGTPPPPPPPNVPPLDEDSKTGASPKSVRERLALHRENPVCGSCHSRIDPMGFALENFDVLGKWRDKDGNQPVDASAELLDGTRFEGPMGLRKVLLDRKDLFVRNLASKLLGYALGRGLTLEDSCTVDDIVAKVKQSDYSSRTLLEEVVLSRPFRFQRPEKRMP
jgi:hypothetical protein